MKLSSISVRLPGLFILLVTLLLLVFGVRNYQAAEESLQQRLEKTTQNILERLSLSLPAPLWNYETEFLYRNIESEMQDPLVARIVVKNADGVVGAMYKDADGIVSKQAENAIETDIVHEAKLVYNDSGTENDVGKVELYIDDSPIRRALSAQLWSTIWEIVLLDLVIGVVMVMLLRAQVLRPLSEIRAAVHDIASGEGDLTQRLKFDRKDEFAELADEFNLFIENLQQIIGNVKLSADTLLEKFSHASKQVEDIARDIASQREQVDMVATASTEMSTAIENVADNANAASELTRHADDMAQKGNGVVTEVIGVIGSLSDEVNHATEVTEKLAVEASNIGTVLDVIKSVSEQTNLLALNAAIEAARAGEQGRGFAVVADEVRTLAQRTHESTDEIQSIISRLQQCAEEVKSGMERVQGQANTSVEHVSSAGAAIQSIADAVDQITQMNTQIAEAAHEQSLVVNDINENIVGISRVAEDSVEKAHSTVSANQEASDVARELAQKMGRFRV
ncbi:MAG: methyl-accepting chemotaxis protein [Gammaproteobacteria bacterium]|nr:MAG: methyl-accepting chemotaxis protein [Gammaproteobacteria bacterium]